MNGRSLTTQNFVKICYLLAEINISPELMHNRYLKTCKKSTIYTFLTGFFIYSINEKESELARACSIGDIGECRYNDNLHEQKVIPYLFPQQCPLHPYPHFREIPDRFRRFHVRRRRI